MKVYGMVVVEMIRAMTALDTLLVCSSVVSHHVSLCVVVGAFVVV